MEDIKWEFMELNRRLSKVEKRVKSLDFCVTLNVIALIIIQITYAIKMWR